MLQDHDKLVGIMKDGKFHKDPDFTDFLADREVQRGRRCRRPDWRAARRSDGADATGDVGWITSLMHSSSACRSPLALAAMGLALIYYLNGIINVAYAETITLGAYFGMWANTALGLNFYGSIVVAGALAGGLSVATYLSVFRPAARPACRHARGDHHLVRALGVPPPRAAVRVRLSGQVLRRAATDLHQRSRRRCDHVPDHRHRHS